MLQEVAVTVAYFCESRSRMFTWQVGWRCWQILFCCFTHMQYTHSSTPACLSVCLKAACSIWPVRVNSAEGFKSTAVASAAKAFIHSPSRCYAPLAAMLSLVFVLLLDDLRLRVREQEELQRKETENWDRGWYAPGLMPECSTVLQLCRHPCTRFFCWTAVILACVFLPLNSGVCGGFLSNLCLSQQAPSKRTLSPFAPFL